VSTEHYYFSRNGTYLSDVSSRLIAIRIHKLQAWQGQFQWQHESCSANVLLQQPSVLVLCCSLCISIVCFRFYTCKGMNEWINWLIDKRFPTELLNLGPPRLLYSDNFTLSFLVSGLCRAINKSKLNVLRCPFPRPGNMQVLAVSGHAGISGSISSLATPAA